MQITGLLHGARMLRWRWIFPDPLTGGGIVPA